MLFTILIALLILPACTSFGASDDRNCANKAELDYISVFQHEGIKYGQLGSSSGSTLKQQAGPQVGQIMYKMSGHACEGHIMKDGDATLLDIGTVLYQVDGYKPESRLLAGGELYLASDNPAAATVDDLLDIQGKIAAVQFVSGEDGSVLSTFSPEAADAFAQAYTKLSYKSFAVLYKEHKGIPGDSYRLRIKLKDGSDLALAYWPKQKVLTPGNVVDDAFDKLITEQRAALYAQKH